MAGTSSPEAVGVRAVPELEEARGLWPRGARPDALRSATADLRRRLRDGGAVRAVRTVDLAALPSPSPFALGGAGRQLSPWATVVARLVVVQYEGFDGELRTLAWNPTMAAGPARTPFQAQLARGRGGRLAAAMGWGQLRSVPDALDSLGLRPEDVDLVSFDHLHAQDVRSVAGTVEAVESEDRPRVPLFPRAQVLLQRREVDTLVAMHPAQSAWYVPGGMDSVDEERLLILDGDVELGVGVALLRTPGHTDGHQSLCLSTPDGLWVCSGNGVAADAWHPHLSKIPGVRRWAEALGREVAIDATTAEDAVDQHDSMVVEKALADAHRADPRWLNVLPGTELAPWRRHWPVVPTFLYGGVDLGRVEVPGAAADAA